ncbi:hypothetical protein [Microbacterium sp. MMO-56]|uniref:hypothetical protein n=1 Tax=Microbacterium sp. MMO-56 TaxID=3081281 RepID=UPI0030160A9A
MGTEVLPPDLEVWATGYARHILGTRALPAEISGEIHIGNKEPTVDPFPPTAVLFRDDGGGRSSILTGTRSMGVSVLAGTRLYDVPARNLARMLFAVFTDESLPILGGPACPVVAITDFSGPYSVSETQDRTRMYFTVEYTVVGTPVG